MGEYATPRVPMVIANKGRKKRLWKHHTKMEESRQWRYVLCNFFFCSPWPKHYQVLIDIIGELMAAAPREDNKLRMKKRKKLINNQVEPRTASHPSS